jgi:hypothetical protein
VTAKVFVVATSARSEEKRKVYQMIFSVTVFRLVFVLVSLLVSLNVCVGMLVLVSVVGVP